jgi:hypothetical protein
MIDKQKTKKEARKDRQQLVSENMWFLGIVVDVSVIIPCKDMIFSLKLQQKTRFFCIFATKTTRAPIKS